MRYAIRHTFPNGNTLGDGFMHAGNSGREGHEQ